MLTYGFDSVDGLQGGGQTLVAGAPNVHKGQCQRGELLLNESVHGCANMRAIALKAVFMVLAILDIATLWGAIAADMGAALLVAFNGLRLLRADT